MIRKEGGVVKKTHAHIDHKRPRGRPPLFSRKGVEIILRSGLSNATALHYVKVNTSQLTDEEKLLLDNVDILSHKDEADIQKIYMETFDALVFVDGYSLAEVVARNLPALHSHDATITRETLCALANQKGQWQKIFGHSNCTSTYFPKIRQIIRLCY